MRGYVFFAFDVPCSNNLLALYCHAWNQSLDLTIDRLGYSRFNKQLARFKEAKAVAVDRCSKNVRYFCDSNGQIQQTTDCLYKDYACGYACLDEVATELNLWQITTE